MKSLKWLLVLILLLSGFFFIKGYVYSTTGSPQDLADIPLNGDPRSIAINPRTDQAVIVSLWPNRVKVIDMNSRTIQATIPVGRQPAGVDVDSHLNRALVTSFLDSTLSIIRLDTYETEAVIKIGFGPGSVAVYDGGTEGAHMALVTHYLTRTVSVVDLVQMRLIRTIRVGNGPKDIAVDPLLNLAVVVNEWDHDLSVIDLNTFHEIRRVPAGLFPRSISINPETHLAAVANLWEAFVSVVDLNNWNIRAIPTDRYPSDVVMNPLNNSLLVVCPSTQTLHHIDLDTSTLLQKYPLNRRTQGVAVNPFTNMAALIDGQKDSLTFLQLPNPVPEILSISPNRVPRGSLGTRLTIEGSGFLKTSSLSLQDLNLPVDFIDNKHLKINLTADLLRQAGTYQVSVNNPAPEGGVSTSKTLYVENPIPTITALDPGTVNAGGPGLTLTVHGSGFIPETTILANEQTRPVNFISSAELNTALGSTDLAAGSFLGITASNPAPGGGSSNQMAVIVSNPTPVLSIITPNSIKAGSPGFTLSLTGSNFVNTSSVLFNNTPVSTTFIDGSRLEAAIPASAITTAGSYRASIQNPAPGGGASQMLNLTVTPSSNVTPLPENAYGKQYENLFPPDATIPSYDPKRFSLITGLVRDASGNPLSGVTAGIHSLSEYGTVRTDETGRFSIPIDGGGTITITYQKSGFITAHRQVNVGWNTIANIETVVLIPEDTAATSLSFDGNPQTILTHKSTPTTDDFGTRSLTVVLAGDNRAWVKDAQGIEQPLTNITVRATEYPTPESMPAKLPPTSAFTYCIELNVDGANSVRFEKPVALYVDNFLGFNVGEIVPVGYYDRDRAVWVPSNNGVVVRLLDTDGDGIVDAYTDGRSQYPAPGLTNPNLYIPGASFWRVEISHFTPVDCNWPFGPLPGSLPPNPPSEPVSNPQCPNDDNLCINSYVENRSRIFHEDIPIPGTDMTLHYASSRTVGYKSMVTIPVSGSSVSTTLRSIIVRMEVAGRIFETILPPQPNQKVDYVWDGLDYFGRPVFGSTLANISIGFVYPGSYYSADSSSPQSFARAGVKITGIPARGEAILWRQSAIIIQRGINTMGDGWTLSPHHFMSPADPNVLHRGDGATINNVTQIITTIAGNGQAGFDGDGGPAVQAKLSGPWNVTVDKAGNTYIADTNNHRVRKVEKNGIITTFAGNGQWYTGGDGSPANQVGIGNPLAVTVDDAGNVFFAADNRIRKVDINGIITTVAGNGQSGYNGDGVPAVQASLAGPTGITMDNSGNLYIADSSNNRIRKVDTNGLITTIAGNGQFGYSGDGGPALQAKFKYPSSVVADDKGNIFISDFVNHRIRKVDSSGIITTVAGNGQPGFSGDGGPAIQAQFNNLRGIAVDRAGNLYLSDRNNERIRKINASGIITTLAGNGVQGYGGDNGPAIQGVLNYPESLIVDNKGRVYIAEMFNNRIRKVSYPEAFPFPLSAGDMPFYDENGQGYIMTYSGLHKATIDLETGKTLLTFGYDENNKLISITDRFGNQTTIQRDGSGLPGSITSPDGIVTRLTIDGSNHLTAVAYPDNSSYSFTYTTDGLMTDKYDPRRNRFRHQFDVNGLINNVFDPEGGIWSFSRSVDNSGTIAASVQTAEGNTTTYQDRTDSTGAYTSIKTDPSGSVSTFTRVTDGLTESEQISCGMSLTRKYDLDPAFRYKYLKELTQRTPAGLTLITTDNRTYRDTNGDVIPDLINRTQSLNGKNWTTVNNTLTGTFTSTSPIGRTITRTYDPLSLLTQNIAITGLLPVSYQYDSRGRLTTKITGSRTSSIAYDNQGNVASIVTPDQKMFGYTYDPAGRIKIQTMPDNTMINYDYDQNGNMTILTNPNLISYGFDYSGVNLRRNMSMPLSGNYQYSYDTERNLKSILFPSGKLIENTYVAGLISFTTTPEGVTGYTYNCGSSLKEATRGAEKVAYTYDGSLLKTDTRTGLLNQIIGYVYNNDFQLSSLSYGGASQSFTYDNDGLLSGAGAFAITRNAQNGLPVTVSDGTLVQARTFSAYGELDGVVYNFGGANKFGYTLTRDPAGRITQKTEIIEGDTAIYDYAYDANGRLIEVRKNGSIVETYTYDANGNRLTELNTLRGINRSYTVSAEDHLITAGTDSYQFDADGFLTGKTSGSNTSTYQYSSRGELLSATLPGSTSITYDHDPLGRRIAKRVNGAIIEKYLWKDAITLMAVYDASDNLLMRFHYADGRTPVSMSYNGSTYYLAYDQVGSLKTVSDAAGNIIKRVDYDSFGSIINDTNPSLRVSIGFAGGLHDRDTGLVRFGARDYDPALGRWTAKDPINFVGGDTNLYGYVQNDPVNWVDPFGLTEQAALIGQYVSGALARGGLGVSPSPWEIPNWLIPPYGRWGGPGRSGPGKPIDSLDKCFRTHDMDYLSAGIEDWNNIDSSKIKDRKKCDRKVSNCISELPLNPLLWESPPPWWMPIEYATLYRIGSGALFRWMGR